jgi:hypothetical protein
MQRDIQDTFNAAVGGFITIWFEGHEEVQEPTAMQIAIAEAKQAERKSSPEESSRARRKKGKSRAELENAKRPFSFRTDPVNLAFGEIKAWGDVPGLAEERGYQPWDEVSKPKTPEVLHAAADVGKRRRKDGDTESESATDIDDYVPPSEKLCTECKLVHPTPPKENVMGKMEYDGLCDYCGGRVKPKRKVSRMAPLSTGGGRKSVVGSEAGSNPWSLPPKEAERLRAASAMGEASSEKTTVLHGRRSGSVSPTRMGVGRSNSNVVDDGSSPPGPNAKPRLGRVAGAERPPPRSQAQGGLEDKLSRTMANWGGAAGVGVEKGFPANWPSAYPDYGLPFTSDGPISKKAVISKLTNPQLYTGTHRHRFDKEGKGRGLAGRDYLAKGAGSVQGRRAAHQALCLRQVRSSFLTI